MRGGEKKRKKTGERSSKIVRYDVTGAPRTEEQKERMKINKNSRERRCRPRGTLRRDKGRDTCYYSTIRTARNGDEGRKQDGGRWCAWGESGRQLGTANCRTSGLVSDAAV